MKTWLKELEKALSRKFYEDEVKDIVSYYEEMIEERRSSGENIDDILSEYKISEIVKTMTPNVLLKRPNRTHKDITKNTKQLVVVLLSTPFLLPLGILYVTFLIVAFSMMLVTGILILSSFAGIYLMVLDLIQSNMETANILGIAGFSMMTFSFAVLVSVWIYQIAWHLSKKMLVWFSNIARKKGELR
ncbi:DUF1700 domain-containing protein [Peloplasma aerotolerans]|uniref:DUF1700 domain-containing protein n=1 Tax=Peloplasma aerotolerans TaxID=3044389 RepID=A0AAW6U7Y5_9MOLU|nr:DUF1700 domain-containing protein [Mariniplasma sp. M4Ah]MDI6452059.1 DUF1700 domain-containing protein [Mariniplasma sp. M4Ah]